LTAPIRSAPTVIATTQRSAPRAAVVDASVAVKWVFAEDHTEAAPRLLNQAQSLLAPAHWLAEAANRGDLNGAEVQERVTLLAEAPVATTPLAQLATAAMRIPAVPVTDAELWAWSGAWLRPYWTRSHKAPTNNRFETPTQCVRMPTNRIDRDPFERPFSLTPNHVRRKEIAMRTLVPPPPSQRCDICRGELRLKAIEPVEPLFLEMDIEMFVCARCGHEQSHRVGRNHYAAHTASNVSHAKMG
jgi:hypothetical protein